MHTLSILFTGLNENCLTSILLLEIGIILCSDLVPGTVLQFLYFSVQNSASLSWLVAVAKPKYFPLISEDEYWHNWIGLRISSFLKARLVALLCTLASAGY